MTETDRVFLSIGVEGFGYRSLAVPCVGSLDLERRFIGISQHCYATYLRIYAAR